MKDSIILLTVATLLSTLIISVMKRHEEKPILIGTSADLQGAEHLINEFYYSTSYKVDPQTLAVSNDKGPFEKVKVALKRGRYRIEVY